MTTHPFHQTPATPAEARTGISDRAAAALADVAYVRRWKGSPGARASVDLALDRIEQALRHE